jgi:hypothetical protein
MAVFKSRRNKIFGEGFVVEITGGRGGLRYSEGERTIEVDSEFWGGERGLTVYADSIQTWVAPSGLTPVGVVDVKRIAQNIVEAFKFDGYRAEIRWPSSEPG